MLLFIIALIVVAAVIEWQSLKDRLQYVRYSCAMSKRLAEPGESFEIVSVIENTSRLPMSYIEINEYLPVGIGIDPHNCSFKYSLSEYGRVELKMQSSAYLWPKQRIERRITANFPKRGRHLTHGANLKSGDFFGFSKTSKDYDSRSEIVVMPARAENAPEITALGGFLGDISVRRFIMEDPVLTLGFRDYTGTEPQKAISWKQSARLGRLMVKQYDYTLEPSITVLLNVQCGDEKADAELIERCFSIARSVCEVLEDKRIKYGFMTNATTAGAIGLWSEVTEGLGASHLGAILEGLGRATYEYTEPFEATVGRAARAAENGRSHVIITPFEYESLNLSSKRLRDITGGEILVVPAR